MKAARFAFEAMPKIWEYSFVNTEIKLRLFCASILSVLVYGSSTGAGGQLNHTSGNCELCRAGVVDVLHPTKVINGSPYI